MLPGLMLLIAAGPIELQTLGDETYAEQVVAFADLPDGTYAKIRFGVSNVGPGDGKAGCEFFVVRPDGSIWKDSIVVEREKWNYAGNKLTIGPCSADANGTLVMKAPLSKGTVEIELAGKPTRTPAGRVKSGSDFWELDLLVKWAAATVKFTEGGRERTVKGHGYADHPRSRILPGDLAKRWFRFRGVTGSDPRLVMIRYPKSGNAEGWHDSKAGRVALERMMMKPTGKNWQARFKGQGGEWRVTTTQLLHRSAPVEERGAVLSSLIGAVVGNPVTYTFRGVLEERGSGAKVFGIVEITITDE